MTKYTELLKLAKAAVKFSHGADWFKIKELLIGRKTDAAYIARADPQTIIGLVEKVRAETCKWKTERNSANDGEVLVKRCTDDYFGRQHFGSTAPKFCPECGGVIVLNGSDND